MVVIVTWNVKLHAIVDPLHAVCVTIKYVCYITCNDVTWMYNVKLHAIVDPLHTVWLHYNVKLHVIVDPLHAVCYSMYTSVC